MTQELVHILTALIAGIGIYLLIFLWSNAALRTMFARFNALRVEGRIRLSEIPKPSTSYFAAKRVFDFFFALAAIIFLFPVFIVVTLLIKLESRGPILYKQRRIGLHGKPYWAYKFRTMHVADEEKSRDFPRQNDPRITRVGRFLRLTALDELPAFINVLDGNMSLVGRSRILDYDKTAEGLSQEEKETLLGVRPGVVSLWALSTERLQFNSDSIYDYEMYYLMRRSFWFDLKVILGSVVLILGATSKY